MQNEENCLRNQEGNGKQPQVTSEAEQQVKSWDIAGPRHMDRVPSCLLTREMPVNHRDTVSPDPAVKIHSAHTWMMYEG